MCACVCACGLSSKRPVRLAMVFGVFIYLLRWMDDAFSLVRLLVWVVRLFGSMSTLLYLEFKRCGWVLLMD